MNLVNSVPEAVVALHAPLRVVGGFTLFPFVHDLAVDPAPGVDERHEVFHAAAEPAAARRKGAGAVSQNAHKLFRLLLGCHCLI